MKKMKKTWWDCKKSRVSGWSKQQRQEVSERQTKDRTTTKDRLTDWHEDIDTHTHVRVCNQQQQQQQKVMNNLTQDRIPSLVPHSQRHGERWHRHHRRRRSRCCALCPRFVAILLIDKWSCVRPKMAFCSIVRGYPLCFPWHLDTDRQTEVKRKKDDDRNEQNDNEEGWAVVTDNDNMLEP